MKTLNKQEMEQVAGGMLIPNDNWRWRLPWWMRYVPLV